MGMVGMVRVGMVRMKMIRIGWGGEVSSRHQPLFENFIGIKST
jgi:hypothetical protein